MLEPWINRATSRYAAHLDALSREQAGSLLYQNPLSVKLAQRAFAHYAGRGDNRAYQKFIVIAEPRSGSNLLCSTLHEHPSAICRSEALGADSTCFALVPPQGHSEWLRVYRDTRPQAFMSKFLFGRYSTTIAAVGFKLFVHHAMHPSFRPMVTALLADEQLKVILLWRENRLEQLVSTKIAHDSKEWIRLRGNNSNAAAPAQRSPAITISVDELKRFITFAQGRRKLATALVGGRSHYKITYEALSNNFSQTMHELQTFLNLPAESLPAKTEKQSSGSLASRIANYSELEAQCRGTELERYFSPPLTSPA